VSFKDQTVWITGAGSGIGKALAKAFANEGATIILSGRNMSALENAKKELIDSEKHHIIALDLANRDGIEKIFNDHQELIQKVDVLINNAGISQRSLAKDTEFSVYEKLMEVNYLGTIKLSLLLLDNYLAKNSGRYIVISSVAGKIGVPVRSGYSGAKFALHGFFEALRAELYKTKIKIHMVCPGFIRTDISKNALTAKGQAQGLMDDAQANGMSPEVFAQKLIQGVRKNKAEIVIGGFREAKLAIWVSRFFPGLLRRMIARSKVT